ncbi:MAG: TPM domain-containing protein, partial [Akkermansiaceae bacterium]
MQDIHRRAAQCPHCGFALPDLDDVYGGGAVRLKRLGDMAGALRLRERQKLESLMDRFESSFPQLFFSVYYGALEDAASVRQFGMWLLNHAVFEDVDPSRANEGGVLLVVDLSKKMVSITYGYILDPYLDEDETFQILAKAHPDLLQGNHLQAACVVLKQLTRILKKKSKHARRHPELYD